MKWKDITQEHNGRSAKVWADSTPKNPRLGEGPFEGTIKFPGGEIPVLEDKYTPHRVHNFAWWWDVELT